MIAATTASDARSIACFGFGLVLPLLGGGNVLFLLDAETGTRTLAVATVGFVAVLVASTPSQPLRGDPTLGFLAVFIGIWIANLVFRPIGPRVALEGVGVLGAALIYVAVVRHPLTASDLSALVVGLVAGTMGTAVYGQYQWWEMFPRITLVLRERGIAPFLAVNANFYNANCYAAFVAAVALVGGERIGRSSGHPERIAWVVAIAALLAALWLAQSRSALFLLLIVSMAIVGAQLAARRLLVLLAVAGTLVVLGSALAASWFNYAELWNVGLLGRVAIWRGALRMIADHWLFGVGLGGFAETFYAYQITAYYTRYPHSFALEMLAEVGLLGFLPLAAFLVCALLHAARSPASRFYLGAAVLMLTHASLDIDWHAPANIMLLFLLLGVSRHGPEPEAA